MMTRSVLTWVASTLPSAAAPAPALLPYDWFTFGMDILKSIVAGFMVGVGVLAAQWWVKGGDEVPGTPRKQNALWHRDLWLALTK